jgi:hypothetical protein
MVVVAASTVAACSVLVPLSRVDAAEARWRARGPQSYNFILEIGALTPFTDCSPRRRIDVEVRNGRTTKFGTCTPDAKLAQRFGSVPQIFATIREDRKEHPPRYLVRFNSSLGYPEHIDANFSREMTDFVFNYYVEDFVSID